MSVVSVWETFHSKGVLEVYANILLCRCGSTMKNMGVALCNKGFPVHSEDATM